MMHFGHTSISTNEGAHTLFKKYLEDRTGDLLTIVQAAHTKIQDKNTIKANIAQDFNRKLKVLQHLDIFDDIKAYIIRAGLKLIYKQF